MSNEISVETINNILNFDKVISAKMEQIKRIFIADYGVEYADLINEQLSNVYFAWYISAENLEKLVGKENMDKYSYLLNMPAKHQHYLEKEGYYFPDLIDVGFEQGACILTSVRNNNGNYVSSPILFIDLGSNIPSLDVTLFHELNHVVESSIKEANTKRIRTISGWRSLTIEAESEELGSKGIYDKYSDAEIGEFFYLNENINEFRARDLARTAQNEGFYIINTEKDARISSPHLYACSFFLTQEFYSIYKEDIIDSRLKGDLSIIFNKVGKENFMALNELVDEFSEIVTPAYYEALMDDLKDNYDTYRVEKYYELCFKRDKILKQMQEYSLEKDGKIVA